ncbi:MAG: SUMF1/EgtB/PvdO family nonheme iron enzyme [Planctomycetota bacterium]
MRCSPPRRRSSRSAKRIALAASWAAGCARSSPASHAHTFTKPELPVPPHRVLRGGSFDNDNPRNLRSAYRNRNEPTNRNENIGFRVVRPARRQHAARDSASAPCRAWAGLRPRPKRPGHPAIPLPARSCRPHGRPSARASF